MCMPVSPMQYCANIAWGCNTLLAFTSAVIAIPFWYEDGLVRIPAGICQQFALDTFRAL